MGPTTNWKPGAVSVEPGAAAGPKAVLFVLDCSGSMGGTRLNSCKKALEDIYDDNISDGDQISLVTFASDVRVDLDWTTKAGSERTVRPLFRSLDTRGMTAMFDAVSKAVELTGKDGGMPAYSNWIVLLCDGPTATAKDS